MPEGSAVIKIMIYSIATMGISLGCVRRTGSRLSLFLIFCIFLLVFFWFKPSQAEQDEKTYTISLVKTAEKQQDNVYELNDRKVLTEEYTINKGEWVWNILREKGLLNRHNLPELISVLEKLNRSLPELDLIHPGEKIIIPLKIEPIAGGASEKGASSKVITPLAALKDLKFESYMVKQDDSLIKVIKGRYNISFGNLHKEYLELARKLNPAIKDLDLIYPGQVIKLPIYSPEVVRKPIPLAMQPKFDTGNLDEIIEKKIKSMTHDLGLIFLQMGEDWIQTGKHFIPLKSGGQLDLNAESFPIINPHNGVRVIVDLYNRLPAKMAKLIESSWGDYRVVHLDKKDDLMSALGKILQKCNYAKLFRKGEAFELGGKIPLKVTGDWVVTLSETQSNKKQSVVVINLRGAHTPHTPQMIKHYLAGLGIKVIDHPQGEDEVLDETGKAETLKGGKDSSSLIATILDLTGQAFSAQEEISVFQSKKADLKLNVRADFSLKIKGRNAIIILTDFSSEVISFLKENKYLVLNLAGEKDPLAVVSKTLKFLGAHFDTGPHSFMVTKRDESKNIKFTVPGDIFIDALGHTVLATPLTLPDEIAEFLSKKGYKILVLSFS